MLKKSSNLSFAQYFKMHLLLVALGLILVIGFNASIDPYGSFKFFNVNGINAEKALAFKGGGRRLKATELVKGDYQSVILGNSRALYALDPNHPVLRSRDTYNLGLPGTNIHEIYQTFRFAREKLALKSVIFPVSFDDFTDRTDLGADYKKSRFSGNNIIWENLPELISFSQINDSVKTILINIKRKLTDPSYYTDRRGMNVQKMKETRPRELFNKATLELFQPAPDGSIGGFSYSEDGLVLLRNILRDCLERGIKIYLFIPPVHARHMEAWRLSGDFSSFEQWKRDLVKIVAETAEQTGKPAPLLWDFTGYNPINNEAIPADGSENQMQWYVECSHFTKKLGDLMIDLVLSQGKQEKGKGLEEFGATIDSQNIEAHLAQIRSGQAAYQRDHAFEVREVENLLTDRI
jgi:hypothetical protein